SELALLGSFEPIETAEDQADSRTLQQHHRQPGRNIQPGAIEYRASHSVVRQRMRLNACYNHPDDNHQPGQEATEAAAALFGRGGDAFGAPFVFIKVFHLAFLSRDEAEAVGWLCSIDLSLRRLVDVRAW